MPYLIRATYVQGIFYTLPVVDNSYIFTTAKLVAGDSVRAKRLTSTAEGLRLPMSVGTLFRGNEQVGYLFKSPQPLIALPTGLLYVHNSWRETAANVSVENSEIQVPIRTKQLCVYHVPNKGTLVVGGELDDKLHSYLTMI
jgi:hypothetical protein